MKRALLILGLAFAGIAVFCGVWAWRLPWAPQADFDVLGVLWLITNVPKLFGYAIAGMLGVVSLLLFWKAWTYTGVFGYRPADEEARILSDPRFHGILNPYVKPQVSAPEPPEEPPPPIHTA